MMFDSLEDLQRHKRTEANVQKTLKRREELSGRAQSCLCTQDRAPSSILTENFGCLDQQLPDAAQQITVTALLEDGGKGNNSD